MKRFEILVHGALCAAAVIGGLGCATFPQRPERHSFFPLRQMRKDYPTGPRFRFDRNRKFFQKARRSLRVLLQSSDIVLVRPRGHIHWHLHGTSQSPG